MAHPLFVSKRRCDVCGGIGRQGAAGCNGCAGSGRQEHPVGLADSPLSRADSPERLLELLGRVAEQTESLREAAWHQRVWDVHDRADARLLALRQLEHALGRVLAQDGPSSAQQILEAA